MRYGRSIHSGFYIGLTGTEGKRVHADGLDRIFVYHNIYKVHRVRGALTLR